MVVLIIGIILFLKQDRGNFITEILKGSEVDIIEHSQQYNLLYSTNLKNSLPPECTWESVTYKWNFPEEKELNVYKTSVRNVEFEQEVELTKTTYENIDQSIKAFFGKYSDIEQTLSYDYEVQIYSEERSTYEKMPLYLNVNDFKVLTTKLGIWRDTEGKYIAGFYEIFNGYKRFSFNKDEPDFSFPAKSEKDIRNLIESTEIKFLNHEYLCEDERVEKSTIISAEIVYTHVSEYLFPVYKIVGEYKIATSNIKWTALINPIDFAKLDYTIYEDTSDDQLFIPKPFITNISLEDGKYYIGGLLPHKLYSLQSKSTKTADDFNIQFLAKEQSGEYVWDKRKEQLEEEIKKSLKVDKDGKFNFNFSADNFWKVEKIFYEDENGNEVEPYHSPDNEIARHSFDDWFKIKICTKFTEKEYCGESSSTYYLEPQ